MKKTLFPMSQKSVMSVSLLETDMKLDTFNREIVPIRMRLMVRARQLTGDGDSAEDLVQEVMLRLWSMRDELDRHTNHEALAMAILRNMATDRWRRQKLERESMPPAAACTTSSGEERADAADDVRLIERIVDGLPPLQSRIFRMKELEGYEPDEIMAITGCTPESLRQNLSRARRRIREEFLKVTTLRG